MFLAPPRSGSRQSPDMGDLMATDVLVSLHQTLGLASSWQWRCAAPSPPWWLWTSPCCKDPVQRLPVGSIALSPGLTMRNQQAEYISCVFLGLCSGLYACFPTCPGPACSFVCGRPVGPASSLQRQCFLQCPTHCSSQVLFGVTPMSTTRPRPGCG